MKQSDTDNIYKCINMKKKREMFYEGSPAA